MAYGFFNPNPSGKRVGDCVVRGISFLTSQDWEKTYLGITLQGYEMFDMPSSNAVWSEYLKRRGYKRYVIPDTCPDCYTVKDFCKKKTPSGVKKFYAVSSHNLIFSLRLRPQVVTLGFNKNSV